MDRHDELNVNFAYGAISQTRTVKKLLDISLGSPELNKTGARYDHSRILKSEYLGFQDEASMEKDTEMMRAQLKRNATLKIKGRLLLALAKNITPDTRTAYVRWWVRTHRKYSKKCITNFALKSKVSVQVAFWRFKKIAAPFKKKRKHYVLFMEKIINLVEIMEHRQKARLHRSAFYKIRLRQEMKQIMDDIGSLANLSNVMDTRQAANFNEVKTDSNLLSKQDIFQRMIKGVMGKYLDCFQKLKGHRLASMLGEKLSHELLQRLLERLIQGAEGKLQGTKHLYYNKMKANKRLFDRKKAICRRVLDANFRSMSAGWNNLIQMYREHMQQVREKVKYIVKCMRDKDAQFVFQAWKGMVERKRMMEGVGMGKAEQNKLKLLRRLMDKGYDLQVQAWNALSEWKKYNDAQENTDFAEKAGREEREKNFS